MSIVPKILHQDQIGNVGKIISGIISSDAGKTIESENYIIIQRSNINYGTVGDVYRKTNDQEIITFKFSVMFPTTVTIGGVAYKAGVMTRGICPVGSADDFMLIYTSTGSNPLSYAAVVYRLTDTGITQVSASIFCTTGLYNEYLSISTYGNVVNIGVTTGTVSSNVYKVYSSSWTTSGLIFTTGINTYSATSFSECRCIAYTDNNVYVVYKASNKTYFGSLILSTSSFTANSLIIDGDILDQSSYYSGFTIRTHDRVWFGMMNSAAMSAINVDINGNVSYLTDESNNYNRMVTNQNRKIFINGCSIYSENGTREHIKTNGLSEKYGMAADTVQGMYYASDKFIIRDIGKNNIYNTSSENNSLNVIPLGIAMVAATTFDPINSIFTVGNQDISSVSEFTCTAYKKTEITSIMFDSKLDSGMCLDCNVTMTANDIPIATFAFGGSNIYQFANCPIVFEGGTVVKFVVNFAPFGLNITVTGLEED